MQSQSSREENVDNQSLQFPAGKRCPRVDFEVVHAWRTQKMDICETNFNGPRKKIHYFEKKILTRGEFEPQSIAWKSSVKPTRPQRTTEI